MLNSFLNKKKFFIIYLIFIQLMITFPVFAESKPELSVAVGYNGKCRLGGINPISIMLQAGNEDFDGKLIVNVSGRSYTSEIQLSSGIRKAFDFHIPLWTEADNIKVQLYKDGKYFAEKKQPIEIIPQNSVIIGVLKNSSQAEGYTLNCDKGLLMGRNIYVEALDEDMSYTLEELENINFIFIDDFQTDSLSEESSEILKQWIENGNCAFVGGGSYSQKTMTGIFKGFEAAKHMAKGAVIPVKEDLIGISSQNLCMLIEKYATRASISKIMTGNRLPQAVNNASSLSQTADNALLPSMRILVPIIILLTLYLVCIGAANIMRGKMQWLFGTAVVIFSGTFLILSYITSFGQYRVSSAAVKVYGGSVQEYRLTNISSRNSKSFELSLHGASMLNAGSDCEYYLRGNENIALMKLKAGDTSGLFSFRTEKNIIKNDSLVLKNDGSITGKIKNPMAHKLQNCFLIVGDTAIKIGALDGKESIGLQYRLDHNLKGFGDYNYIEAISKIADADEDMKQLIEYYFYNAEDFGDCGKLIGFSSEKDYIYINDRKVEAISKNIDIFDIDLKEDVGSVYVSTGIIRPVAYLDGDFETMGKLEIVSADKKKLMLYYALPYDIEISKIQLEGSSVGENGAIEGYNRFSGSWETLKGNSLEGQELDSYITGGSLLIRLETAERVILPQISVYGIKN